MTPTADLEAQRQRVRRVVAQAFHDGRLVRPAACDACGVPCKPDGHHDDYDHPLMVRWLCHRCHAAADVACRSRRRPSVPQQSPWLSSAEARAYICCPSIGAWYMWKRRHGIIARGNGSVAKADLDRALKVGRKRHVMSPASIANLAKSPKRMATADPVEKVS